MGCKKWAKYSQAERTQGNVRQAASSLCKRVVQMGGGGGGLVSGTVHEGKNGGSRIIYRFRPA